MTLSPVIASTAASASATASASASATASATASAVSSSARAASQPAMPAVLPASAPAEQKESAGVQVSFSDAMRERLNDMRKMGRALKAQNHAAAEARKQEARQRIERIRQQIKQLMMLIASLGGLASRGVLHQIEQLARSLGQAASVLKEGGGATDLVGSAGGAPAQGADESGATDSRLSVAVEADAGSVGGDEAPKEGAAQADTSAADAAAAGAATVDTLAAEEADAATQEAGPQIDPLPAQTANPAQDDEAEQAADVEAEEAQRAEAVTARRAEREQQREDAELIRKAVRELKALLALVKASMGPGDEDAEKQVKRINQDIQASEKAAQSLSRGSFDIAIGDAGLSALSSISVTV